MGTAQQLVAGMLVEPVHDRRFRAGATGRAQGLDGDFRRSALPLRGARIDGVKLGPARGKILAQPARLLFAQWRKAVVVFGEKRSLTVARQIQQAHLSPCMTQASLNAACLMLSPALRGRPPPEVSSGGV